MAQIFDNIEQRFTDGLKGYLSTNGVTRVDFCVGYFNLRGWNLILNEIDALPGDFVEEQSSPTPVHRTCRLLIGMHQPHEELTRWLYSKEDHTPDNNFVRQQKLKIAADFRRQLQIGLPTKQDEWTLRRLSAQMKNGKVCVKLYVRHPLHAKLYIAHNPNNYPHPVYALMGSSNLTYSGLTGQGEYVDMLISEMIPEVGKQGLADFIDVFCDEGFFTPDETSRILEAGAKWGMRPKIHVQELAPSGGVEVGVKHNAVSVDHLESMIDEDIEMLKGTNTIPTGLPGTSFFLNMPFAPARKMIEAGLPVATASDYNPGSTPSGDMKFVVSLACIKMRLLPAEAINAATINTAAAMDLSKDYGSIAKGKIANFFITEPIPSIDFIPYSYTTPIIARTFLMGQEIK